MGGKVLKNWTSISSSPLPVREYCRTEKSWTGTTVKNLSLLRNKATLYFSIYTPSKVYLFHEIKQHFIFFYLHPSLFLNQHDHKTAIVLEYSIEYNFDQRAIMEKHTHHPSSVNAIYLWNFHFILEISGGEVTPGVFARSDSKKELRIRS